MSSPSTNGAISTAFQMMGPLTDALLFPFDGFSADDFFATALPPPAPQLAVNPTLPPSCNDHGSGSSSFAREVSVAAPGSSRMSKTVATAGRSYPQTAPGTPPLLLVQGTGIRQFGSRTSFYRGVTKHRWTGRYEAHLWDNTARLEGQKRKGRQVYLGGYEKEERAARAYDLAALKYWGVSTTTNFPKESYIKEIGEMKNMSRQELVASLRRNSSGFSRGASIYRGVTRHHHHGRWQARIGRVAGNKDLYLGTFETEEEAAEAYDIAALKFRGDNAVTNFEPSRYNLEAIARSEIPISGPARQLNKLKPAAPEAHGEITLAAPPFSQQSINSNNYLLHNLLQLQPCDQPLQALPLPCYSFGDPIPTFYCPLVNVDQKVQLDSKMEVPGGLLPLANSAAN